MGEDNKKVSRSGRNRSNTKEEAQGPVLEVENPVDLWYLCQKIDYALGNPMQRSDGIFIYQRVVSIWIRQEAKVFDYNFPWVAEVGYDMTTDPPSPIMSQKEPFRPSEFPLSQYSRIRSSIPNEATRLTPPALQIHEHVVDIEKPLVGKTELENDLIHPTQRMTGLMRIPDVIALDKYMMTNGAPKFSQDNLSTVIEIKFPNDKLWKDQKKAYERIAGDTNKFRLMRTERCKHRRRREWEEAVNKKQEPAFVAIREGIQQNQGSMRRLSNPYPLITSLIEQENFEVKRLLDDATRIREEHERRQRSIERYGDHVITAAPSREEEMRREQERRQAKARIEMVLAGPMVIAAAGVAASPLLISGGGGAAATGVVTTTGTTIATGKTLSTGGTVIYLATRVAGNPAIQRVVVATTAANASIMRAAASERTETSTSASGYGFDDPFLNFLRHNVNTYEDFYYWIDSVQSYQVTDFGIVMRTGPR